MISHAPALSTESLLRRSLAAQGLWEFVHVYLSRLQTNESGWFHRGLCYELDQALAPGGRLIAACPREHAKTTLGTIALALNMACLASYHKHAKRNILIVGSGIKEAVAKLRNIIMELEFNPLLQADFGDSITPLRDRYGRHVANRDEEVLLKNGVRLAAVNLGGKIRGSLADNRRLDLVILDDPEDDKMVRSDTERGYMINWVDTAMMNALDLEHGSLVWLGTLLHHQSLLNQMLERKALPGLPGYKLYRIPAILDDDEVLWPERWTIERLERRRLEIGSRAFSQEFLNEPVSAEDAVWRIEWFRYYDPRSVRQAGDMWIAPVFDRVIKDGVITRSPTGRTSQIIPYIACDPAISRNKGAAQTAIVVMGEQPETGDVFYLDTFAFRGGVRETVSLLRKLYDHWHPRKLGIEEVAYQAALTEAAWDRNLPAIAIKSNKLSKEAKIEASAVHTETARMLYPAGTQATRLFMDQALKYPRTALVDVLDAAQMCLSLIGYTTGRAAGTINHERRRSSVTRPTAKDSTRYG